MRFCRLQKVFWEALQSNLEITTMELGSTWKAFNDVGVVRSPRGRMFWATSIGNDFPKNSKVVQIVASSLCHSVDEQITLLYVHFPCHSDYLTKPPAAPSNRLRLQLL